MQFLITCCTQQKLFKEKLITFSKPTYYNSLIVATALSHGNGNFYIQQEQNFYTVTTTHLQPATFAHMDSLLKFLHTAVAINLHTVKTAFVFD